MGGYTAVSRRGTRVTACGFADARASRGVFFFRGRDDGLALVYTLHKNETVLLFLFFRVATLAFDGHLCETHPRDENNLFSPDMFFLLL